MKLTIYIHYWLLFFRNDNSKSLNTKQHLKEESFSFSLLFSLIVLSFLFKLSCTKKHHVYNTHCILYTLSFCYVMYYIVPEICIGWCFLEDSFYRFSQFLSVVASESIIPYNTVKPNNGNSNQIKKCKYNSAFKWKIFFHTNIDNKIT